MDEIYASVENVEPDDGCETDSKRFHGAAVLCLGLLSVSLLAGIIGLGVRYHQSARGAAAELSTIKSNLTELLRDSESKVSSLTEERDQLNISLMETNKELNRLQRSSRQKKTGLPGWTMFGCSFYLLSTEADTWTKAREDCRRQGADLVVIGDAEEQVFLSGFARNDAWIGLSDADREATWTWIDGTPLTLKCWGQQEPNNGGLYGDEDCAQFRAHTGLWNDLPCATRLRWICEK